MDLNIMRIDLLCFCQIPLNFISGGGSRERLKGLKLVVLITYIANYIASYVY